jgi:hypothetical protein
MIQGIKKVDVSVFCCASLGANGNSSQGSLDYKLGILFKPQQKNEYAIAPCLTQDSRASRKEGDLAMDGRRYMALDSFILISSVIGHLSHNLWWIDGLI